MSHQICYQLHCKGGQRKLSFGIRCWGGWVQVKNSVCGDLFGFHPQTNSSTSASQCKVLLAGLERERDMYCYKGTSFSIDTPYIWALPKQRLDPPTRIQPGTLGHFFRAIFYHSAGSYASEDVREAIIREKKDFFFIREDPFWLTPPTFGHCPFGVGGLNACPDGLGQLFKEELSKFKWAYPCFWGV